MTPQGLFQWRKAQGLSKRQAAARLGVMRVVYRQFEAGTRSIPDSIGAQIDHHSPGGPHDGT